MATASATARNTWRGPTHGVHSAGVFRSETSTLFILYTLQYAGIQQNR